MKSNESNPTGCHPTLKRIPEGEQQVSSTKRRPLGEIEYAYNMLTKAGNNTPSGESKTIFVQNQAITPQVAYRRQYSHKSKQ